MNKTFSIIFVLCILLSGCSKKPSDEIGYGELKEGLYTNGYFNMAIQFPDDWVVQNEEALKNISEQGSEILVGDNENLKASIKAAEKNTLTLFAISQYEQGTPVPYNPNICCVAEKMKHMPGVKRGSDYYFHLKKVLESGQLSFEFPHEIYTEEISDISFDILPAIVNIGYMKVYQKYYAARIKDYVLLFSLSYSNDEEEESLMNIMNTLIFSI